MAHGEGTLREVLRAIAHEHKYDENNIELKEMTSGGANYTSQLYLATIATPPKPDLKLFAKVGNFGEKIRSRVNVDRLYRTEELIYKKLISIWNNLQEKYQVPQDQRFVFPKYYGGSLEKGKETVVLENLVAAGYSSFNRFKSLDWEHASSAVTALAKYHALSFVLEKEDPELYDSIAEQLQFEKLTQDGNTQDLWAKMVGGAVEVIDEQYRDKVFKYFKKAGIEAYYLYNKPRGRAILVHGDYRPSNLLFKRQENKLQTIVIDYQTVRTGCPVTDLVYLIFLGSDGHFRKHHYEELVEHYYQELRRELDMYHIDIDDVYPREEFDDDLKASVPYALLLGVLILPVVTVEAESAPRTDDVNADLDDFIVTPNELYAERFSGLVKDLVRMDAI